MSRLQPLPCGSHRLKDYGRDPVHLTLPLIIIIIWWIIDDIDIAIDASLKGSNAEELDTALPVNLIECYDDDDWKNFPC